MKVENSSSSVRIWISISFVILAIVLELTMVRYWSGILEPRLRSQAQTNAQLLAQSQAIVLADVLSRSDLTDETAIKQVQSVFDLLLLAKDPALDEHLFIFIALEVDYDAVTVSQGVLDISQGELECTSCFEAPVELYSRETEELLGVVTIYVSDAFFRNIRDELKERFIVEGVIAFMLLFLLWIIVINLVHNLYKQIEQRKKTHEALLIAKEQAESANEARGQFLANMSHEIRTPMNAIIGLCYVVLKTDLSNFQRNYLTKVHSSARSLLTLINDILDFSKIESGKFDLEKIDFDMDEVLESLSQMIMPRAAGTELDILYSVEPEVPYQLKGDPFRLGQILLNLINNAIKFTEEGEIVVSITVAQEPTENQVKLLFSVRDTGVGIAENARDKLFSSFTQADNSMSRKYGGTGLGLAICKNLAEMMSGEIWVESELGKGSTFFFTAVFELDSPEQFNRFIIPEEISHINVLVVDDNETSRLVYSQMMKSFHFDVTTANSAEQGISLIQEQSSERGFELVLMDWKMPGLDGIKAAQMIKSDASLKHTPSIILVSAHAHEETFLDAQEYLDAYLLKPVCQSTLYDCIVGIFCQVPRKSYSTFSSESVRSKVVSNFKGRRILLVEDNKTNREVAMNLLDDVQLSVDCAVNGKEAVEAIKNNTYDLVLMDVQMPQMDGITATEIIRKELNCQTSIVAMTAHAMQGDKDKCLAVGMNDYLTKPIDVEHFYQTLEKWLPKTKLTRTDATVQNVKKVPVTDNKKTAPRVSIDYPGIDYQTAMTRLIGNESLLLKLIANFEPQNRELVFQLQQLIDANQFDEAKRVIHGIKGEAGNIAANSVFALAVELENAFELHTSDVSDLFEQFKEAVSIVFATSERVRDDLVKDTQEMAKTQDLIQDTHKSNVNLNSAKSIEDTQVTSEFIHQLLAEIAQLLSQNNLKAKKLIEDLAKYLDSAEFEFEHSQLNHHMNILDFKNAYHQINELSEKLRAMSDA